MLVAVAANGRRVTASEQLRGQDLTCPACARTVTVRVPRERVAHFAHQVGTACAAERAATRRARKAEAAERAARARAVAHEAEMEIAGQQKLFDLDS